MPAIRVALTMRIVDTAEYVEPRDAISHDWERLMTVWGATPFLVPNMLTDPASYLREIETNLLVLTGGGTAGGATPRDRTEVALLDYAITRRMPVLGVCRGFQAVNVHAGGSTIPAEGHTGCSHSVSVSAAWRQIYGDRIRVNSFHDRCIASDTLAPDLVATAFDEAGRIEAAIHRELPIAGVMWHPEREGAPEADRRLMETLIGQVVT